MKKNILLLIAPFLLSGCVVAPLQDTSNQPTQEENGGNQDIEDDEGETGGNQETPPVVEDDKEDLQPVEEYTQLVMTSGDGFHQVFPEAGLNISTSEENYKGKALELQNLLDNQLDYEGTLTKIECTNLHTCKLNSTTYLQFGSGSDAEGSLTWYSTEKMYSVSIEFCNYAKYDDYLSIWMIENAGVMSLDDVNSGEALYSATTEPITSTLSKPYPDGVTSFTISSSGQRVLLKSITITWRG